MVNTSNFVNRLEKILDYFNLTASALAEKIDFNRSTISHLLAGRNKPSLEFVMKLHQQFPEIDVEWLLFGSGKFPPTSDIDKPSLETQPPNLFSEVNSAKKNVLVKGNNESKNVEKIVIFYDDGSFNVYQN